MAETHVTPAVLSGLVLACYDGSDGSREAMRAGSALLGPRSVVVLTVWEPIEVRLRRATTFGALAGLADNGEPDEFEEAAAHAAAEEGAKHAIEHGFQATARVARCNDAVWRVVVDVARELQADGILIGNRGRGPVRSNLLGSTSHAVLNHAHCPVLVAPEAKP